MLDCEWSIAHLVALLVHPHACAGSAGSSANGPQLGSDGPAGVGAAPARALPVALDGPAKPVSAVGLCRGFAGLPPVVPADSVGTVASRSRAAALASENCPKLVRAAGVPVRPPLFAPDAPASSVGAAVPALESLARCKGLAARAAVPAPEGFAKLVGADAKAFARFALLEPEMPAKLSVKVFAKGSARVRAAPATRAPVGAAPAPPALVRGAPAAPALVRAAPATPALVRAVHTTPAQSCHVVDQLLALLTKSALMQLQFEVHCSKSTTVNVAYTTRTYIQSMRQRCMVDVDV